MPKVLITVRELVTYSREVEMSEAEWHEWDRKTDQRGKVGQDAVEDLTSKFIRRTQDWQDADDLELMDLSLVLGADHALHPLYPARRRPRLRLHP